MNAPARLFIEGHSKRDGYIVSRIWTDEECSRMPVSTPEELAPVRLIQSRVHARRLVERFNRFAAFSAGSAA